MVRAILAGAKTQTRRVVKYKPGSSLDTLVNRRDPASLVCCPYGVPGDRLWVREACLIWGGGAGGDSEVLYQDDEDWSVAEKECRHVLLKRVVQMKLPKVGWWRKVPSIYMPRWASRITLELTEVRVQRVQEITDEDARAEGAEEWHASCPEIEAHNRSGNYRNGFHDIWDSVNAKRGFPWSSDPWVWALTFRRVQP
jgi:hypothetical protein